MIGAIPILVSAIFSGCTWAHADKVCTPRAGLSLVRIDQPNERLFVQASPEVVSDLRNVRALLRQAKEYVERCQKTWSRNWSISIFSEAKYAGYKDEKEIRKYVMDGSWERAYLGEYDNQYGLLVRYPLHMSKRTEDKITVE